MAAPCWLTASSLSRRGGSWRRGCSPTTASPDTCTSPIPTATTFWGCHRSWRRSRTLGPVALAESIPAMQQQISPGYMQVWSGFFPGQLTSKPVAPAPLAGTTVPVGGSVATLIPVGTTDTGHSSVVHVPGLSLVISGDAVYNQTHMWLRRSTPDSRASWARALDAVAALEADTLIAGHRNPRAADDHARRQIGECRRYLADFEAALERSSTPAELIDRLIAAYPEPGEPLHAVGRGLRPPLAPEPDQARTYRRTRPERP